MYWHQNAWLHVVDNLVKRKEVLHRLAANSVRLHLLYSLSLVLWSSCITQHYYYYKEDYKNHLDWRWTLLSPCKTQVPNYHGNKDGKKSPKCRSQTADLQSVISFIVWHLLSTALLIEYSLSCLYRLRVDIETRLSVLHQSWRKRSLRTSSASLFSFPARPRRMDLAS